MAHCLLICFAGCCVAHSVDPRGVVVVTVCHPSWAYVTPVFTTLCCAAGVAPHEVRTQRLPTFLSASQGVVSRKVSIPAALVASAGPPTGHSTHMLLATFAYVRKMFSPARFRSPEASWSPRLVTWAGLPHRRGSLRSQLHRKLLRRKKGGDTNVIVHAAAGLSCRACGARKSSPDLGATRGSLWKVCCRIFQYRPRSSRCRTRWGELLSAPRVARRVVPDVAVSHGHTDRDSGHLLPDHVRGEHRS